MIEKSAQVPGKALEERIARQLCEEAGFDPDSQLIWEGEYGYANYPIPKWTTFKSQAKKLIASEPKRIEAMMEKKPHG